MGEWLGKNRFPIPQVIKYTCNRTIMRKKKQQSVVDPRDARDAHPSRSKFFNFSFRQKLCNIIGWHNVFEIWHHLWGALDPLLTGQNWFEHNPTIYILTYIVACISLTQSQNLITLKCFASDCDVCTGSADKFYHFMKSYLNVPRNHKVYSRKMNCTEVESV